MPLFMDFHKGLTVTVEDVKNAYIADERVQDRYGVKDHQFCMNEGSRALLCWMRVPTMNPQNEKQETFLKIDCKQDTPTQLIFKDALQMFSCTPSKFMGTERIA